MQTGSIGDVVFAVSDSRVFTWKSATHSVKARFARHEVFNRKPHLEFTGPDVDGLKLTVALNRSVGVDPDKELKRIEELAASGEEQLCILGGRVFGWFVIESAEETFKTTDARGRVTAAELTLSMTEFVREPDPNAGQEEKEDELSEWAEKLKKDITDSPLGMALQTAEAAAESAIATAQDVADGVIETIQGAVSTAEGFVADAVGLAVWAGNAVMKPANVAIAAMQHVVSSLDDALAPSLEDLEQQVTKLCNTVSMVKGTIDLVGNGPEPVKALLWQATSGRSEGSLRRIIGRLGSRQAARVANP